MSNPITQTILRTREEWDAYNEQVAYYRLCDEAAALGIPTSLDDPRSPKTVVELQAAVDAAK